MKILKISIVILTVFIACNIYADIQKVYIEYEYTDKSTSNKISFKLYKDGDKYKLIRKLSNSPGESGTVTGYIDVQAGTVISVAEKIGVKKGLKSAWDDDYFALIMEYNILFRGIPKGKSFKNYTKASGTETVNGRECDIYESGLSFLGAGTKYYMWNDIMLKAAAPDYTTAATNIDENPVFSESEFIPPADVTY